MRTLFLIDSFGAGGAERSTLDFCLHLRNTNHAVKILCLRNVPEGVELEALSSGIDVHFLREKNLLSQLWKINRICKEFRPDLVHSVLFESRLRGRLHKLLYFKKHLLFETLVNVPFQEARLRRIAGKIKIFWYRCFDSISSIFAVNHYIAISEMVKTHFLREVFFLKPDKVTVIYRGRDSNQYLQARESLRLHYSAEIGYSKDAIVFIHVGRQDFQKNHEFLIAAFQKLLEKDESKKELILLCLGRKGDMSKKIELLLRNHPCPNIFFLGYRSDVSKLLSQSDIFVFPSLYEGVGGAIIEAKAAGLPVIVSNLDVFHEVLKENSEALFVDLANMDEFAAKMKLLAGDEEIRKSMGIENLKSFRERFSSQKVNHEVEMLYQRFLEKV